jgi:hypothetical protein
MGSPGYSGLGTLELIWQRNGGMGKKRHVEYIHLNSHLRVVVLACARRIRLRQGLRRDKSASAEASALVKTSADRMAERPAPVL